MIICHLQRRQPYKITDWVSSDTSAYIQKQIHGRMTFDSACTLFVFEDGPQRQKDFSLSYACQWI